ncbi:3-oxoacyl-reductase FabG [Lepidopterella palustris CBS 459.81]|uniref:3-oxoacyl-reductase FabG n=1 Tax=Lepidopterella palustris CBS 459.81 TaxID=1314670 RepID=A0A8E2EBH3_9PEZI|nr:3-oxoacyl-reductase FabG [Lepidopterella palustris CBS 459.81]
MPLTFPNRFKDKIVAITGGASGLGAAMATRYIAEGAFVVVLDMCSEEKGQEFISQFPPGRAHFHRCDIGSEEGAAQVVQTAVSVFGGLDILHNNASAFAWGQIPDIPTDKWSRVFRVGVDAPFFICRAAIPEMRKRGGGAIVNTASTAGLIGDTGLGCYNAAKAALVNLTRAMGADHAREGIRINAIVPGWMDTPMTMAFKATKEAEEIVASSVPMHRAGQPEEVAAAALFLASEDASYITATTLIADGGLMGISRMPDLAAIHTAGNKTDKLY